VLHLPHRVRGRVTVRGRVRVRGRGRGRGRGRVSCMMCSTCPVVGRAIVSLATVSRVIVSRAIVSVATVSRAMLSATCPMATMSALHICLSA